MKGQGQGKELSKPDRPASEARPRRWPKGWSRTPGPKLARTYRLESFREGAALVGQLGRALEGNPPLVATVDGCKVVVRILGDGEIASTEETMATAVEDLYQRWRGGRLVANARQPAPAVQAHWPVEPVADQLQRCRELLRLVMKRRGRTHQDVQDKAGWGVSFISQLVNGHKTIRFDVILILLEAIDLHPAEFFAELYGFDVRPSAEEPTP